VKQDLRSTARQTQLHGPMMSREEHQISIALRALAPSGVMTGHRLIGPRDAASLLAEEEAAFKQSVLRVKQQSGAARRVARDLLSWLGIFEAALPRSQSGAPIWPSGIVGSLAHDGEIAVAAIARAEQYDGLGIDVEPALSLPSELVDVVATSAELRNYSADLVKSRLLFVAKEAIYKAQYPIDAAFLEFRDIEIDLDMKLGVTRTGRRVSISFTMAPRVFALAFIPRALTAW